jgi:excisionase family DNA binding protein
MQSSNPFDIILARLDQLQSTVNTLSEHSQKTKETSTTNPDRLLDLPDASQMLRKPVGTVRYYIHHRNLPATKIGKSYLIKLSELLNWFDEFNKQNNGKAEKADPMLANRIRYRKH